MQWIVFRVPGPRCIALSLSIFIHLLPVRAEPAQRTDTGAQPALVKSTQSDIPVARKQLLETAKTVGSRSSRETAYCGSYFAFSTDRDRETD